MKREKIPKSYKEIISIPEKLRSELPSSYDVVGDIALIKLSDNLLAYKKEIANAFLEAYKHIKTVCLVSPVSGELRTRDVEIIGGEKHTETVHKEYGLRFVVDVQKTYFSLRLANERKRIASLVRDNETVVDMFTGVAPFPIMIAKYANPEIIYAFDKNKHAIEFAKENIKINRVLDKVELIHTDALNIPNFLREKSVKADRVIMNLPFSVFDFYPEALQILDKKGIIHYYEILTEEKLEKRVDNLKKVSEENKFKLIETRIKRIKSYSPREFYIGIDITVKKN